MNIWIWFFFMLFVGLFVIAVMSGNDWYISQNKATIMPLLVIMVTLAVMFEYVALRTFQKGGLGEAWSLGILSLGTAWLFNALVKQMQNEE